MSASSHQDGHRTRSERRQERTPAAPQKILLFDHLVGAGDDRSRYGYAQQLRGYEIDDKFKLRRLLDRQFTRFRAAKNLVRVLGCAPEHVQKTWTKDIKPPALTYSPTLKSVGSRAALDDFIMRSRLKFTSGSPTTYTACVSPLNVSKASVMSCARRISGAVTSIPSVPASFSSARLSSKASA